MTQVKRVMGATFALLLTMAFFAAQAFADGGAAADNAETTKKFIALAVGFGLAFAAGLGALAQGRAASAALEGIARNPNASDKLFTPLILSLALIESLVIYSLVISFTLVGKL
jgi:F-type H+-transporting ATPase subunit c